MHKSVISLWSIMLIIYKKPQAVSQNNRTSKLSKQTISKEALLLKNRKIQ